MANPLLKRLLGEALEDPVEHHLSTVGAGKPPAGRSYPEVPASDVHKLSNVEFDAHQFRQGRLPKDEEGREVQIGQAILAAAKTRDLREIEMLAHELIDMHTTQPPA